MDGFLPLLKYSDFEESEILGALGNALTDEGEIELVNKLLQYNFGYSETNYLEKAPFLHALTRCTLNASLYIKDLKRLIGLGEHSVDRTITRNKSDTKNGSVTTKTKVATTPTLKGLSDDYVDEYSDTQSKSTGTSEDTTSGNENVSESLPLTKLIEIQSEHRDIVEHLLGFYVNLFYTYLS